MINDIITEVKEVIANSVKTGIAPENMPDDLRLAGDSLDSMAVTSLVLGLEEHFGFTFDDEDLSAEAFETVATLSQLVEKKLNGVHA
ncbi:acyl carrier protein [bacterium]|nr:acyl carrier protein [bacterium]